MAPVGTTKLKTLHEEQKVTVLPAIGYTSPNQSHFTSRHYWEVGETNPAGRVGWLGRYLDQHGTTDNPLQGLSLDYVARAGARDRREPGRRGVGPVQLQLQRVGRRRPIKTPMLNQFGALGGLATGDPQLAKARGAVASTDGLRTQLASFGGKPHGPATRTTASAGAWPRSRR